jgi:transposase-like protein/Zn ribbon nucleic-acid-binding protein
MEYPKTQIEFERAFATNEQCFAYLAKLRFSKGFICPKCNHNEYWTNSRGLVVCVICKYQLSITAGTIFHKSRTPMILLFRVLWSIVAQKNGISATGVQKILGLKKYSTAWTWLHKFRRLMVLPNREKLSGMIEVDETLVGGKRSGKRGRGAEGKILVIIAVEKQGEKTGRVRLSTIRDASKASINQFIKNNIAKESVVVTDGWKGYNDLSKMKYVRQIEDQKLKLDDELILPKVHKIASLLKRWLLGTHQNYVSQDKLDYYLDEFTFRYNRRTSNNRGLLFFTLLKQAVIQNPIKNFDIIKASKFSQIEDEQKG